MSSGSTWAPRFTWASLTAVLAALTASCTMIPADRQEAYSAAVDAVQNDRHETAAAAADAYLQGTSPDDPRYDRALMIIGRSCEQLGLTYAASVLYRDVASSGRNLELLPDALRGLERVVRSERFDRDQIINGFVAGSEFAAQPDDVEGFLSYYRGLDSIRRGFDSWGDEQFERIPVESEYHWRAVYVHAVRAISNGQLELARELLEWILSQEEEGTEHHALLWNNRIIRTHHNPTLPDDLRVEIRRALARMAFEERRFEEAMSQYDHIREIAPDDPEILLEMAWTYFYLGDSRRALGRLIALDAPIHRGYIAPERYVLEAFCLRRICQFGAARQAAVRLWQRHGDALDDLLDGVPVNESEALRRAARRRQRVIETARFQVQVRRERTLVEENAGRFGESLTDRLMRIYDRGVYEAQVREESVLEDETRRLAAELLDAEEGVRLVVHELSVSMLRGRRRPTGAPERPAEAITAGGERVFYGFTGEFWTDELDDLVVVAEDRCID